MDQVISGLAFAVSDGFESFALFTKEGCASAQHCSGLTPMGDALVCNLVLVLERRRRPSFRLTPGTDFALIAILAFLVLVLVEVFFLSVLGAGKFRLL